MESYSLYYFACFFFFSTSCVFQNHPQETEILCFYGHLAYHCVYIDSDCLNILLLGYLWFPVWDYHTKLLWLSCLRHYSVHIQWPYINILVKQIHERGTVQLYNIHLLPSLLKLVQNRITADYIIIPHKIIWETEFTFLFNTCLHAIFCALACTLNAL